MDSLYKELFLHNEHYSVLEKKEVMSSDRKKVELE